MLKKQKIDITYPRKCPQCNYEANNPASYSYHKKTHQPIPQDTKCHFGCGQNAIHTNTGGKHTCQTKYQQCPSYLEQLAERTKRSWKGNTKRKEQTKKIFEEQVVFNEEARSKSIQAIKDRAILKPEDAKSYKAFARKCRLVAQQWAKENGHSIGQQTYHVDHKMSILEGYYAGLTVNQISHPANLQILEAKKNSAKGSKSILTKEKLLERINLLSELT